MATWRFGIFFLFSGMLIVKTVTMFMTPHPGDARMDIEFHRMATLFIFMSPGSLS